MSFFTALFEPLINRHRVSWREMLFSLLGVLGIFLIFNFDTRYRAGIGMGVVSSALASLFTICNKKVSAGYPASTMLLYDWIYLLLFASVCTVWLYILQIQVLKQISAFTFNLTYNLEPIYSIIGAMILFGEARDLNFSFYIGLGLIFMSVVLQSLNVLMQNKKFTPYIYVKWKR